MPPVTVSIARDFYNRGVFSRGLQRASFFLLPKPRALRRPGALRNPLRSRLLSQPQREKVMGRLFSDVANAEGHRRAFPRQLRQSLQSLPTRLILVEVRL